MSFKNIVILLLLMGVSLNMAMASSYSLPPDFAVEAQIANMDATLPTIMPPPIIVATLLPKAEKSEPSIELDLQSHSDGYRIGDTISFSIKSNQGCYLTVLNVGTTGKTTVLFPNKFRPDNYIDANKRLSLPSEALMPVEALHIGKPDNSITDDEIVIAICRKSKKPLFKQAYQFDDYNFRTFSTSENWQKQITTVKKTQEARTKISFSARPAL